MYVSDSLTLVNRKAQIDIGSPNHTTNTYLIRPTSRIGMMSVSKKVLNSNCSEFQPRNHLDRPKDFRRPSYFNKMAVAELPGTIDFLTDAAHLLRTTAPETSAHLMSHRGQLLQQYGIAISDIQQQHTCGGCGLIIIPGQEATLKIDARRSIRKKTKGAKLGAGSTPKHTPATEGPCKTFHCDNCQRDTKIPLPAPGPAVRRRVAQSKVKKVSASVEQPKQTTNASSKKRAKNRKVGLQALLSGQKQQTTNPLSLSHFMK